jgi:hypothetical protein
MQLEFGTIKRKRGPGKKSVGAAAMLPPENPAPAVAVRQPTLPAVQTGGRAGGRSGGRSGGQSGVQPAVEPTVRPVVQPTVRPVVQPTVQPTEEPFEQPVEQPVEQPDDVLDPRLLAVAGLQRQMSQLAAAQRESQRLLSATAGRSQGPSFRPLAGSPAPSTTGSATGQAAPEMNGVVFSALQTLHENLNKRIDESHKSIDEEKEKLYVSEREANAANLKLIGELRSEISVLNAKYVEVFAAAASSKAEALEVRASLVAANASSKLWFDASVTARKELKDAHESFLKHLTDMTAGLRGGGGVGGGGGSGAGGGGDYGDHRGGW